MTGERKALAIPSLSDDLVDFAPRTKHVEPTTQHQRAVVDTHSAFPSREASEDAQLNLKGPKRILDRFKSICKADRRPYYDMLEILLDAYEAKK